jgi:hypothetical protein
MTGAEWQGRPYYHHRRQESSESSSESESVMSMPHPQLAPPPVGMRDTAFSPPFKPFPPLPRTHRHRPPTPPKNIMALSPYKNTFKELVHPTPNTRAKALEIIRDPERTNIETVRRRWQMEDEEREKMIKEKREMRERLINGSVAVPASLAPTLVATDPRFIKKKKTRKSLFGSLSSAFRKKEDKVEYANVMTFGGFQPVVPSIVPVLVPPRHPSPVPSAHTLVPTPGGVSMPIPAVAPSPFLPAHNHAGRSTTPPYSPRNPSFVEPRTTNKYAGFFQQRFGF